MIEITQSAQEYFGRLIAQQEMDDVGLQLTVLNPGTPIASCDLQFHVPGQSGEKEIELKYDGFNLYVAEGSEQWLEAAKIDFEKTDAGGQLTIKAPGIKGDKPDDSDSLEAKVSWVLQSEINPGLASHGGQVTLEQITPENEVVLRFGGGCHGCGMVNVTLQDGIEKTLKEYFPEIKAVVDATDHATGSNPYYK
ncbi:MAG: NifU family protein [Lysobacterales bacterium]